MKKNDRFDKYRNSTSKNSKSEKKRDKKSTERKNTLGDAVTPTKRKRRNLETNILTFIFLGVFLVMIGYSAYFTYADALTVASSPYNPRNIEEKAPPVRRGTIYAADGTELAKSTVDGEGKEHRTYPTSSLFSSIVGMSRGGGSGVEGAVNTELTTCSSGEKVDVELNDGSTLTQYIGNDVYTTLDTTLQKVADEALGSRKGAVIAVDPTTGKVLACVSKPNYDPNEAGEMYNEWASYSDDDSVLINRATQGLYSPGSTFKILTFLEYVKENPDSYSDFTFECEGTTKEPGGTTVNCYNKKAHGTEDLTKALVNSCNCAFSHIGTLLNMDYFKGTAESIGMNSALPLETETSVSKFTLDESSDVAAKQQTAFGQGELVMSPLQICMMTSVIANGGNMMKPYIIDRIVASNGNVVKQNAPSVYKNGIATEEETAVVGSAMREMVKQSASKVFSDCEYEVAGKTGTAEYGDEDGYAHSWFTCYAPYDDPQIVVTCLVEKTDGPSSVPEKICREVVEAYLDNN